MQVDIREAKTRLSRLIARALNGEEVVIAKAGRPLARLDRATPVLGNARGQITFHPDWDKPLELR